MATRIGIMAEIGLDGRGFRSGLMSAEKSAAAFSKRIGRYFASVFSVAAIGYGIKTTIEHASRIRDMADAIGMSAEQFQELEFAAKQTGASMETVTMAIKKIAQAQQAALIGGGESTAAKTFERLGVSMSEIKTLSPHQIFSRMASAVQSGQIGMQNMADILDVMGKQANTLIPAMTQGFAGMAQQARDFGLIIEEEVIDKLDDMGDKLDAALMKWQALRAQAVIGLDEMRKKIWGAMLYGYTAITGGWDSDKNAQALEAVAALMTETEAVEKEKVAALKSAREQTQAAMQAAAINANAATAAAKPLSRAFNFNPPSDELAKIGGFIGGTGTQVGVLRSMDNKLGRLVRSGERTAEALEEGF